MAEGDGFIKKLYVTADVLFTFFLQAPCCEADNHLSLRQIPRLLCNPKMYYEIRNSQFILLHLTGC